MSDRELMQRALETIETLLPIVKYITENLNTEKQDALIAALRARLAQPEQAKCRKCGGAGWVRGWELDDPDEDTICDRLTKYTCDACESAAPVVQQAEVLTDDMLRYAMGAMGIGSPKEADKFRAFWRFAIEARTIAAAEKNNG